MKGKKVYVMTIGWSYDGDTGHDLLDVYADYEEACKALRSQVEEELTDTWITDMLTENLEVRKEELARISTFINTKESFYIANTDGDYTDISVHTRVIE